MAQVSRRTGFTGSALVRLLARLADCDPPDAGRALADRLSPWISWTDAISLSAALNSSPAAAPAPQPVDLACDSAVADECVRVRSALAKAIVAGGARAAVPDLPATSDDFAPYRRHCAAQQQAMAASIRPLRERLRAALAASSGPMARLAGLDAVMEQALGPHERSLLSSVPGLLEKHFARGRPADGEPRSAAWLERFNKDMQAVLLAELDVRLQPIDGLLDALRLKTKPCP